MMVPMLNVGILWKWSNKGKRGRQAGGGLKKRWGGSKKRGAQIITWVIYKRQARCSKCDLFNTKIQCFSAYHLDNTQMKTLKTQLRLRPSYNELIKEITKEE